MGTKNVLENNKGGITPPPFSVDALSLTSCSPAELVSFSCDNANVIKFSYRQNIL